MGPGQGVHDRRPGVEVSQESSPGPVGELRSPRAKQIWVKWEGGSKAVDVGGQMREEIENWVGAKIGRGLYMVCDGRRAQWGHLVEIQEQKVVEIMAEMSGGMGQQEEDEEGKESECGSESLADTGRN